MLPLFHINNEFVNRTYIHSNNLEVNFYRTYTRFYTRLTGIVKSMQNTIIQTNAPFRRYLFSSVIGTQNAHNPSIPPMNINITNRWIKIEHNRSIFVCFLGGNFSSI